MKYKLSDIIFGIVCTFLICIIITLLLPPDNPLKKLITKEIYASGTATVVVTPANTQTPSLDVTINAKCDNSTTCNSVEVWVDYDAGVGHPPGCFIGWFPQGGTNITWSSSSCHQEGTHYIEWWTAWCNAAHSWCDPNYWSGEYWISYNISHGYVDGFSEWLGGAWVTTGSGVWDSTISIWAHNGVSADRVDVWVEDPSGNCFLGSSTSATSWFAYFGAQGCRGNAYRGRQLTISATPCDPYGCTYGSYKKYIYYTQNRHGPYVSNQTLNTYSAAVNANVTMSTSAPGDTTQVDVYQVNGSTNYYLGTLNSANTWSSVWKGTTGYIDPSTGYRYTGSFWVNFYGVYSNAAYSTDVDASAAYQSPLQITFSYPACPDTCANSIGVTTSKDTCKIYDNNILYDRACGSYCWNTCNNCAAQSGGQCVNATTYLNASTQYCPTDYTFYNASCTTGQACRGGCKSCTDLSTSTTTAKCADSNRKTSDGYGCYSNSANTTYNPTCTTSGYGNCYTNCVVMSQCAVLPLCNTGAINCTGWNTTANTCYSGNSTRTCTHNTYNSGATACTNTDYTESGTVNNCSAGFTCNASQQCTTYVTGNVYADCGGNGAKDTQAGFPADTNYPGASVSNGYTYTSTDGNGNYTIGNLSTGNYNMSVGVPVGYRSSTANPVNINLSGATTVNFGLQPLNTITGSVFIDTSGNGFWDTGEPGYNLGASLSNGFTSTTTNTAGNFTFPNLPMGTYNVTLTIPPGYTLTTAPNPKSVSFAACTPSTSAPIIFGITKLYTISGNVFVDNTNKDGLINGTDANYTGGQSVIAATGQTSVSTFTGAYTFTVPAGQYTVSYQSVPSGYRPTQPTGAPPQYTVTVGSPGCSTSSAGSYGAQCDINGNITNLNFGIATPAPWFQGVGGDMRIDAGFVDQIPTALNTYALLTGTGGTSGVAFSGSTSYYFCQGASTGVCQNASSQAAWVAGGSTLYPDVFKPVSIPVVQTSYSYLQTTLRQNGITPTDLSSICTLANCSLPVDAFNNPTLPNGVYQANGNLNLNIYTFPLGKNYVFLINGDLTIRGKILVPVGSTATFVASGNILVIPSVGEPTLSSTATDIEGFYSADGSFILQGIGNCSSNTQDYRLNIGGAIVTNAKLQLSGSSVQNLRDLCGNDMNYPSFYIIERPDFLLNAPQLIKHPNSVWQETAP